MAEYDRIQGKNRFTYYWQGYPYTDASDFEHSGDDPDDPQGTPTRQEVQDSINAALDGIYLERVDDDTLRLVVGGRELDPDEGGSGGGGGSDKTRLIDDVFLSGVESKVNDDDERVIVFNRANDASPIEVDASIFDDPLINCGTF